MPGFDSGSTMYALNVDFTGNSLTSGRPTVTQNGQLLIGSTALPNIQVGSITSPDGSLAIGYSSPNITLTSTGAKDLHVAKWIVNQNAGQGGNQPSITAATAIASAGDTIYIMDGTYTENVTLKNGVNYSSLSAFAGSPNGTNNNVKIIGKFIDNGSVAQVNFTGVTLQTNSDYLLSLTAGSTINLFACFINATNHTPFNLGASSSVTCKACSGNLGTTGIAWWDTTGGQPSFYECNFMNSGSSTTAGTWSNGIATFVNSEMVGNFSPTSTAQINAFRTNFDNSIVNSTPVTTAGTGISNFNQCFFTSGSAAGLSIGMGTTCKLYGGCVVNSTNTNAITGAGSVNYQNLSFIGSSKLINTTTQVGGLLFGGLSQAPSAGFIGEQIRATVASGSPVSLTTATATNITSISLTAGIWDVCGIVGFTGATTGTTTRIAITSVSNTDLGTPGDNSVTFPFTTMTNIDLALTIPSFRFTLTATTTIYLNAIISYSAGSASGYGRLSATRVG